MLNFNTGGGSFTPYINYMASIQGWEMSGEDGKQNFTFKQAVFDLNSIQTGWQRWPEGGTPEWVMDESIEIPAPKPEGEGWKRGFKCRVFSKSMFGDEPVREWATAGTGATMGMAALYSAYIKDKQDGKLPVVEFQGGVGTKVGKGTTSVPTLAITKWIDTPEELSVVEEVSAVSSLPATQASDDGLGDSDEADEF